jgi:hypothetical protein
MLSLSQRVLAETLTFVCFIRTQDEAGLDWWAYLAVPGLKLQQFQQQLEHKHFVPETYGTVLAKGFGEPSDDIKLKMEKEYGCKAGKTLGIFPTEIKVPVDNLVHISVDCE